MLVLAGGWWPGLGQSVRSSGSAELSFLQRYRPWPRLQGCLEGPGLIYKLGWHSAVGHFPITTSLGDCCGNLMWKIRSWNVTLDVINELDWDFFILWVNVSTASSWMFNIKKKFNIQEIFIAIWNYRTLMCVSGANVWQIFIYCIDSSLFHPFLDFEIFLAKCNFTPSLYPFELLFSNFWGVFGGF